MPGTWDPVIYRDRAKKWQDEAETLPAGKDRDACMALAEGYANLAALIEETGVPTRIIHKKEED
jgi:hypothetical protein